MISMSGKSHIGRRQDNEDRFVVAPQLGLAVVADGMGGPAAGEIAAAISVDVVTEKIEQMLPLRQAIAEANNSILQAGFEGRGKTGMGTTIVAAQFKDYSFKIAWIGDSRAYLWNDKLLQLTRDHSRVEELLQSGEIDFNQAATHPQRNLITRALGQTTLEENSIPEISGTLCRNEHLLLCSDGLIDAVPGPEIARILALNIPVGDRLEQLIQTSLNNGGKDNITVVFVSSDKSAPVRHTPVDAVSMATADGQHHYCYEAF